MIQLLAHQARIGLGGLGVLQEAHQRAPGVLSRGHVQGADIRRQLDELPDLIFRDAAFLGNLGGGGNYEKTNFFLLLLSFFSIFSQTEFLKFYDLESVEYEKLEYYEGFLREEDIDDNDYETCRLLIYNDFSVAYYYSKKRGNENSIKIYNHAFVMGNELCQKFDTYKIQNEEKTYLILVGYTSTRFERFFYIFDITDKNNICFYKMVSDLFFLYQENEEFFGIPAGKESLILR